MAPTTRMGAVDAGPAQLLGLVDADHRQAVGAGLRAAARPQATAPWP